MFAATAAALAAMMPTTAAPATMAGRTRWVLFDRGVCMAGTVRIDSRAGGQTKANVG
jgi:hypothetical protein